MCLSANETIMVEGEEVLQSLQLGIAELILNIVNSRGITIFHSTTCHWLTWCEIWSEYSERTRLLRNIEPSPYEPVCSTEVQKFA